MKDIQISKQDSPFIVYTTDLKNMGLKKPCLMVQIGNNGYKVASFNNDESLELFIKAMKSIMDYKDNEEVENEEI